MMLFDLTITRRSPDLTGDRMVQLERSDRDLEDPVVSR
jgi:hypothetical protein